MPFRAGGSCTAVTCKRQVVPRAAQLESGDILFRDPGFMVLRTPWWGVGISDELRRHYWANLQKQQPQQPFSGNRQRRRTRARLHRGHQQVSVHPLYWFGVSVQGRFVCVHSLQLSGIHRIELFGLLALKMSARPSPRMVEPGEAMIEEQTAAAAHLTDEQTIFPRFR